MQGGVVTDAQKVIMYQFFVQSWLVKPLHPKYYPSSAKDTEAVQVFSPEQTTDNIQKHIETLRPTAHNMLTSLNNGSQRVAELPRVVHCRDIIGTAHVRPKFVKDTSVPTVFSRFVARTCLDMDSNQSFAPCGGGGGLVDDGGI